MIVFCLSAHIVSQFNYICSPSVLRVFSAETWFTVYSRRLVRVQRQASLDRQNFGPTHNFSILFLLFLWGCRIVLALIIFGTFSIYIKNVP